MSLPITVASYTICTSVVLCFFFNDTATTEIYTLSLHDALPICRASSSSSAPRARRSRAAVRCRCRSEEHTSELQSHLNLVCRLLLAKQKRQGTNSHLTLANVQNLLYCETGHQI